MCHRNLLEQLYRHLESLRQARRLYGPKLAPDFNAIGLFGPDEPRLSFILKELLSPTGSHGQGAIFLELFLKRLPNTMRKMDVHLDFQSAAIAIENKPWAGDQKDQCKDYLAQLALSHSKLNCLLYLSASGKPPSEDSICKTKREQAETDGRFKIIAYPQLIDWLKDCRRECQADRVSFFLNEFIDYIQKQFVGIEMAEIQEVVNIALETPQTLQAALEIANAKEELRYHLLDRLEQQLREKLLPLGWTLEWKLSRSSYWNKYAYFRIKHPQATQYNVCFEFDATQCAGFSCSVCKIDVKLPDLPAVRNCLNQNINAGQQYDWQPWFWNFPAPYWNWAQTVQPWLDIQSGAMAEMIIKKTQAIYTALGDANLLDQLSGNAPPPQNPSAS